MTVIAWDGHTLAADKRMIGGAGYPASTITKIRRLHNGCLLGWAGGISFCEAIAQWINAGADPELVNEKWFEHEDFAGTAMMIAPDKTIIIYEHTFPITVENKFYALGTGSAYATAAMHLGQTAVQAVELACLYETGCGNGVDSLTLD